MKKIILAIFICSLILMGCNHVSSTKTSIDKVDRKKDGTLPVEKLEYKEDINAIFKRFPNLKGAEKGYWKAQVVSDNSGRVPGPSSYWMKGFVVLSKEQFESYKSKYEWQYKDSNWATGLDTSVLKSDFFKWAYHDQFTKELITPGFVGKFYLDMQNGIVFFDVVSD